MGRVGAAGAKTPTQPPPRPRTHKRADRARRLADLLRHQVLTGGFPDGTLPHEVY
ncbi:hypothetical protein ACWCQW_22610 [Streptomyces mirabilis]